MSNYAHETVPTDFIAADGIRYAYRRFGKAGKTPLLFLGYFNSNMDAWDPAVTNGLAKEHELILFDNAGVAASTGRTPSTVFEMAQDCFAFCRALGLEAIDIVGFSLGGMIAQQMALDHAELVHRLILLGTGPRGGEDMTFTELSAEEQADPAAFLLGAFFTPSDASQNAGRRPRSWIAADIVRMKGGCVAEHWDVLQDEATKEESKSGLPMFGSSFPNAGNQSDVAPLTIAQARAIVAPLYDALNQPDKKDVPGLLGKACNPDYRSYGTNEEWLTRDQLTEVFKFIGRAVPDLGWTIKDIQTNGDQIVVRGEATGTPTDEFFGAKPTGQSFKTMALDLFTVKNGKLASCYHVENWMTALEQIRK